MPRFKKQFNSTSYSIIAMASTAITLDYISSTTQFSKATFFANNKCCAKNFYWTEMWYKTA